MRSALDAVFCLMENIQQAKRKDRDLTCLFMDVKGAFDNVSHSALYQTLEHLGFAPSLVSWAKSFTTGRRTTLTFDDEQDSLAPVKAGVPQGSPVSPILFLIYIQPMFEALEAQHPDIDTLSFIDDIKLSIAGRSDKKLRRSNEPTPS